MGNSQRRSSSRAVEEEQHNTSITPSAAAAAIRISSVRMSERLARASASVGISMPITEFTWSEGYVQRMIAEGKLAPKSGAEDDVGATYECPICFLDLPHVNTSSCCKQDLCTDCYVQLKVANSKAACPFCGKEGFDTVFDSSRVAPNAADAATEGMESARSSASNKSSYTTPEQEKKLRSSSIDLKNSSSTSTPLTASKNDRAAIEEHIRSQRVQFNEEDYKEEARRRHQQQQRSYSMGFGTSRFVRRGGSSQSSRFSRNGGVGDNEHELADMNDEFSFGSFSRHRYRDSRAEAASARIMDAHRFGTSMVYGTDRGRMEHSNNRDDRFDPFSRRYMRRGMRNSSRADDGASESSDEMIEGRSYTPGTSTFSYSGGRQPAGSRREGSGRGSRGEPRDPLLSGNRGDRWSRLDSSMDVVDGEERTTPTAERDESDRLISSIQSILGAQNIEEVTSVEQLEELMLMEAIRQSMALQPDSSATQTETLEAGDDSVDVAVADASDAQTKTINAEDSTASVNCHNKILITDDHQETVLEEKNLKESTRESPYGTAYPAPPPRSTTGTQQQEEVLHPPAVPNDSVTGTEQMTDANRSESGESFDPSIVVKSSVEDGAAIDLEDDHLQMELALRMSMQDVWVSKSSAGGDSTVSPSAKSGDGINELITSQNVEDHLECRKVDSIDDIGDNNIMGKVQSEEHFDERHENGKAGGEDNTEKNISDQNEQLDRSMEAELLHSYAVVDDHLERSEDKGTDARMISSIEDHEDEEQSSLTGITDEELSRRWKIALEEEARTDRALQEQRLQEESKSFEIPDSQDV